MLDPRPLSVRHLALSQMKLARMLMMRKDSGHTAIDMLGHEQEGLDALVGFHCVFDSLSHVRATIGCFQKNSIEWASYWKGAKQPLQILAIHDRKHPARRPLVNTAPGSQTAVWPVAHPLFAALHESAAGTSRRFAAARQLLLTRSVKSRLGLQQGPRLVGVSLQTERFLRRRARPRQPGDRISG